MAMFIASIFAVSAFAADVDVTSKVGTSKEAWNSTMGPVNIDGVSMPEKYETTTETLGDVMWQTVTGLENGTYTVELYANARYTPGRGFNSDAADGALNFTYLYANDVEISIEVYHNGDLNNGKSYKLEGVEVTDGTLKMGMTKKAAGSNWHTIQIKSLTYHASDDAALALVKADLKAVLDEANAVSPATEALTAAIATAQGVYDASEDQDEVIAATATLQNAIVLANNTNAVAGATPAAPVVTNFVVNGTFDTTIAPWQTTTNAQNKALASNQQGAFTGNFFENWNGSPVTGKIYQVIENVPNGLYELSICAFVNNFDASVQYVYANADKVALTAGEPTAYTVRTKVEDNTIEVGLEQTTAVANWLGIDNVSLKYLGSASEEEIARADFLTLKDEFDYLASGIYEVMYIGHVGDAYYALSETVWALAEKTDATVEEYEACMADMQKVLDDIKAIDAYYTSTFAPLADECFNVQDNSVALSEEAAEAFDEAVAKVGYMGTMGVATIEDLQTIVAEVEPVLNEYVKNALPTNGYAFNYSFFLANPSFETGDLTGWTLAATSADTGVKPNSAGYATEGGNGDYLFNTWWTGVYLSQEAEGLPNGNYRLTVSLSSGDGGNAATVYLVANGEQKGFVMDHKGEFEDCSIDFKVTDGKISIATVGGNDDETADAPGSYNENGYWWYKSDNYRIYFLGDGGVTGVNLYTNETYYDEWADEEVAYDLEWDMPELTEVGATFKFEVDVEAPEDADKTITWSVSDDKVLSIDETGLLTVIGSGSGYYEVKATAPNGISASCRVHVEAFQEGDITEMEVTCGDYLWVEATEKGATYQLKATYNEDATNVDLVWSSDNEAVATVDQNGLVTIVGNGNAEIYATASSGVEASITVWVEISEETGIEAVDADAEAVIYDLQGRRVEKAVKGVYIVNGKKVLVK